MEVFVIKYRKANWVEYMRNLKAELEKPIVKILELLPFLEPELIAKIHRITEGPLMIGMNRLFPLDMQYPKLEEESGRLFSLYQEIEGINRYCDEQFPDYLQYKEIRGRVRIFNKAEKRGSLCLTE